MDLSDRGFLQSSDVVLYSHTYFGYSAHLCLQLLLLTGQLLERQRRALGPFSHLENMLIIFISMAIN